jgi:hypothetical protein
MSALGDMFRRIAFLLRHKSSASLLDSTVDDGENDSCTDD